MTYRVEWLQEAYNELLEIWLAADSELRAEITTATHTLDTHLATDPNQVGESRSGDGRIAFVPPLAVLFELQPSNQIVWVLHVWSIRRRDR